MKHLAFKLIIFLLLLGGAPAIAEKQSADTWNKKFSQTQQLYYNGRYKEVIGQTSDLLNVLLRKNENPLEIVRFSYLIASSQRALFHFAKADLSAQKALFYQSKLSANDFILQAKALHERLSYLMITGLYAEGLKNIEDFEQVFPKEMRSDDAYVIWFDKAVLLEKTGALNESNLLLAQIEKAYLSNITAGNTAFYGVGKEYIPSLKNAYGEVIVLKANLLFQQGQTQTADSILSANIKWLKQQKLSNSLSIRDAYWLKGKIEERKENYYRAADNFQNAYSIGKASDRERVSLFILSDLLNAYVKSDQITKLANYQKRLQMHAYSTLRNDEMANILYRFAWCKKLENQGYHQEAQKRVTELVKFTKYIPDYDPLKISIVKFDYELNLANGFIQNANLLLDTLIYTTKKASGSVSPNVARLKIEEAYFIDLYGNDYAEALKIKTQFYDQILLPEIQANKTDILKYNNLFAELYVYSGKYLEAKMLRENSLVIATELYGRNNIRYALELARLSEAQALLGNYTQLEANLIEMSAILTKSGNSVYTREVSLLVSDLYSQLGYYEQSRNAVLIAYRGNKRVREKRPLEVANIYDELGEIDMYFGNYSNAEQYLSSSFQIKKQQLGADNKLIYNNLSNLGEISLFSGDYNLAEKRFIHALQIAKKFYGDKSLESAKVLSLFSDFSLAIGDFKKADENLNAALAIYEVLLGKKHFKRAQILNKLALVKAKKGKGAIKEIEALFEESNTLIKTNLSATNPVYIDQLAQQVEVYNQLGQPDKALKLIPDIEKYWIAKLGETNQHIADIRLQKGLACMQKSNFDDALKALKSSADIYKSIFSEKHPDYVRTCGYLARVYYIKGSSDEALELLEVTTQQNLEFTTKYFPSLSFSEKSKYWNQVKEDFEFFNFLCFTFRAKKPELAAKMYNNTLTTKGLLLSNTIKVRQRVFSSNDSSLIQLYVEYIDTKELLTSALGMSKQQLLEQGIDVRLLEIRVEVLEKELSSRSEAFADNSIKDVNWKDVKATLKPNEFAVEILRFRNFDKAFTDSVIYVALVVSEKSADYPQMVVFPKGNFLETKNLKYYRNSVIYNREDILSYSTFLEPVKAVIPDNALVYFSGEGVFNQINLETLYKDGSYAIDKNHFVLVGNTKDIVIDKSFKKVEKKSQKAIQKEEIYFEGNPAFYANNSIIQTGSRTLASLPGAEAEVQNLSSMLTKFGYASVEQTGNGVQEERIKAIENPRVFHIATHGYFKKNTADDEPDELSGNPMLNSGLLLTNGGELVDNPLVKYINVDNGVLTAYEAMNLNFDKTELVVLSACETGLGEVQVGEGVYGLQRSFLIAGADAIIMSLFKVNDDVTQKLMATFYTNWIKSGNKRQAFADAKKQIKLDFKEPKLWGAFVMIEGAK